MEDKEIRKVLKESENDVGFFPQDVREKFDEIEDLNFDEQNGNYEIYLETGEYYEMCAVCGYSQPMNMEAMEKDHPQIAKEMEENNEKPEWNNSTCETRHPAFRPSWT